MTEPPTAELVSRAKSRDAGAFEQLIERHERSALAVAWSLLRNSDRAGDAVQEAFLRAWQRLPSLKEPEHFASWLMQIVRNAAIDQHRRARPNVDLPEWEPAGEAVDPVFVSLSREAAERVKQALDALDQTTREAVMLRYYEGRSSKEIAELLGMSPAAVDMRLSRARGQLKDLLSDLVEAERVGERR